jgi:hypothetical protein
MRSVSKLDHAREIAPADYCRLSLAATKSEGVLVLPSPELRDARGFDCISSLAARRETDAHATAARAAQTQR